MKVLFITHHYLDVKGGGAFASRAIINAFSQVSENITLLYPSKNNNGRPIINDRVDAIPVVYQQPLIRKLLNIYFGKIHRFYETGAFYLSDIFTFDTVVFDNSIASHKLIKIALKKGIKIITIHHNCQYDITKDNTRWYIRIPMLFWVKRAERQSVRYSHLNVTLTESDKIRLLTKYFPAANINVLGIFETNPSSLPTIDYSGNHGHRYIITGNLGVKQTVDSLYYWIKKYYPILIEEDVNAELTIAGKDPQKALFQLCQGKEITIVPSPEDMTALLKESDYYICPIWKGSGIKLRIMDGLMFGLPVVTHKQSLRGYESFADNGVYVYCDETSFRQQIRSLKDLKIDRDHLQEEYRTVFSFESGLARLKSILINNRML